MIPFINNISITFVAVTTILLSLTIFRMNRQLMRLELRVLDAEKKLGHLKCLLGQPKGDVYRTPPVCEACPESSPAACQACHEEEEAYIRGGV